MATTTRRIRASSTQDVIGDARTIVYVHGIGNKPPADVLKCIWDRALFGFDLGERSRMAYWVSREYYPVPETSTCQAPDHSDGSNGDGQGWSLGARAVLPGGAKRFPTADEQKVLDGIERKLMRGIAPEIADDMQAKVIPLPAGAREWLTRRITKVKLRDVYDLFFDESRRAVMRQSLEERLAAGGGPFVVIGHSQGSMIAYDVLARLNASATPPDVSLFVTIGSPLGIQEVQDQLKKLTGQKKLAVPACVRRWVNVSDPLDPVALDHDLRGDYAPTAGVAVEDFLRFNPDSPEHPHSGTGYLSLPEVRKPVAEAVKTEMFQAVAPFVIARDVASGLESGSAAERHDVLVELVEGNLSELGDRVVAAIRENVDDVKAAEIQPLRRFVAARLTRGETERLASTMGNGSSGVRIVDKIWRNSVKRALVNYSIHTVQALPAHEAYHAYGDGVEWAVLDTGINADHPHFGSGSQSIIVAQHDCTTGKQVGGAEDTAPDAVGHGTHVAGIIAGGVPMVHDADGNAHPMKGMAPKCKLHVYKVLGDDGTGRDAYIIRALDHIAELNERSGRLVIHGVNLSLGGPFDAATFGCGFSPLCRELGRLWRQGVLVVVAAGNEGLVMLDTTRGAINANMDLSINDPANLEDCIAVGSVNKVSPHSYGVSYFSSRGPTADGRCKPDVVAPGEKIRSCRHRFKPWKGGGNKTPGIDDYYVEMSGTSMAAPHVSGILAAFLSKRSEFKGQPDRVKEILLANCTDLKRDRTFQGEGLPNLVKMLVAT